LPRKHFERWLNPEQKAVPQLQALLRPFPAEAMASYPVSPPVNNPRNEDPRCIASRA
jgi:putative SOS response-associated peptidase YedK